MAEDFAVGNRTEDHAVLRKDVVHGQDAGAGVTHIGDPAHGLGGKQLQALGTIELNESRSKLGMGVPEAGGSDSGMVAFLGERC